MNRILGYSYDPPPESEQLTVEEYVDCVSNLVRDEPRDPELLGTLILDARESLVLARRLVTAVQILRDTGELDPSVAFYLIALFTEWGLGEFTDNDPLLQSLYDEMREIQRAHGRDPEDDFQLDEAPADWLAISQKWDRRAEELELGLLRALGEPEMAAMRELRRDEYDSRCAEGRARLDWHARDKGA